MDWLKDWVRDRINDAKGILSGAIDAVRKALSIVVDTFVRVLGGIRTAFGVLTYAAKHVRTWVDAALREAWTTLRWLIVTEIPRRAKQWASWAINEARKVTDWVYSTLRGALSTLDKWVKQAVKTLNDWARAAVKWVTDRANWLWDQWTKFVRDVLPRLVSPGRLIDWLWAATVAKFWRWLPSQADRIATWVLGRSVAFTQWLATWLLRNLERLI